MRPPADYYPFGLQMPGRVWRSDSQTREGYTGHELDPETGLNYAVARYYDSGIVRWHVRDPHASSYPSYSPYNYVMGNPISFIDPDGKDTWAVHGTFADENTWSPICRKGQANCIQTENGGYALQWQQALGGNGKLHIFNWHGDKNGGGGNTDADRKVAARRLVTEILRALDKDPDLVINLVGHSHGGNVAIIAANILHTTMILMLIVL
jgi:RHS repeat-associated protein